MTHRMVAAALALAGLLVSVYLWLWKIGVLGVLACGDGGCETVQLSPYAELFGVPVALFGVVGYAALLGLGLAGVQGSLAARRWPTTGLMLLAALGLAFTAYLTYLEAAVIHAWCRWCLTSGAIITAIFAVALAGWLRQRSGGDARPPARTESPPAR
jgi:uncharacterized membrane protein